METKAIPVPLRPYVAARVAYDVDFGSAGIHRGLPSTTVTLVLPIDERLRVSWTDAPESSSHAAWSSLSGLHAGPVVVHHTGLQRGVQLALTPAGARALLGRPAAAVAGELTDLEEAGGVPRPLRELVERMNCTVGWAARLALVDRTLAALLASAGDLAPPPAVDHALDLLGRGVRVSDVASEVGYSRRRLSALVGAECGVGPKQWQRLARFEASRAMLGRSPLSEVAARCGFSDQAHLSREWTALAGCSPVTWLREEFPFVQDAVPSLRTDSVPRQSSHGGRHDRHATCAEPARRTADGRGALADDGVPRC